jgi:AhpD family alkylhydroperoxidase
MQPNPLLRRISRENLPEAMQASWDNAHRQTGDATFIEVSGNNPAVFDWYLSEFYGKVFYAGRIDRVIVELIRLRLANIHGCAFCNKSDTVQALAAGIPQQQIDALPDYERGPFTEREKAALALADVMVLTNPNGRLTEALYQRLRQHFSDGELYELGIIMAVLCGMAKFLFAFDLVEKEDYCPFVPAPAG